MGKIRKLVIPKRRPNVPLNNKQEDYLEIMPTPELYNLFKDNGYDPFLRTIYINDDISEDSAYHFVTSAETIIKLDPTNSEPITLYINSYGGDVYDMFWIIDYMTFLKNAGILVNVVGCGKIMSAGAFITIMGTGKRLVYPNTSIMIHEIQSFYGYDNSSNHRDNISHNENLEGRIFGLLVEQSKSKKFNLEFWKKELSYKDKFYTPQQFMDFGFIDGIVLGGPSKVKLEEKEKLEDKAKKKTKK
jgi:ATP-dependent protease ClpP protease subunit